MDAEQASPLLVPTAQTLPWASPAPASCPSPFAFQLPVVQAQPLHLSLPHQRPHTEPARPGGVTTLFLSGHTPATCFQDQRGKGT